MSFYTSFGLLPCFSVLFRCPQFPFILSVPNLLWRFSRVGEAFCLSCVHHLWIRMIPGWGRGLPNSTVWAPLLKGPFTPVSECFCLECLQIVLFLKILSIICNYFFKSYSVLSYLKHLSCHNLKYWIEVLW